MARRFLAAVTMYGYVGYAHTLTHTTEADRRMAEQTANGFEVVHERRHRRSHVREEALRLQLEYVKERLALAAIVLCDDLGEVVASVGADEMVESLAVQAPWLAATPEWELHNAITYLWRSFPGLKKNHVALRPVQLEPDDGPPLILAGVGHSAHLEQWVDHAADGVRRILRSLAN